MRIFGRRPEGLSVRPAASSSRTRSCPGRRRGTMSRSPWKIAGLGEERGPRESASVAVARRQGGVADRYPHQLSGGQRKRVGLAQALICDPKILLMTSRSDHSMPRSGRLWATCSCARGRGERKAVLFVTHDLEEAIALADRVVIMSAGPSAGDRRPRHRARAARRRVACCRASIGCTRRSGAGCGPRSVAPSRSISDDF